MRKTTTFMSLFLILLCCLTACKGRSVYAMEQDAKEEAMEERYREGITEAQEHIASLVEEEIWHLEFDVEDKYGLYPEEAIRILENYADGEPVSTGELNTAIWAISEYYYESHEIYCGIDDYWID